ncbi:MAG: DNA primase [Flavobacteriaceae bacterium]|nr:DNA primase [Cryomorphaceae bacterium]MBL6677247.1 DNA primase [Flavobacteriaceae bacterium]
MITKETIDKVFEYARVEEVISDFIALKKTGANFKGLSPFTNEKTPSFIVSPSKQIWKDFSSGKGGNVIAFLMEHEQFNYPESVRYLANKYNIEVIETTDKFENVEERNARESLFIINSFAQEYFQNILSKEDKVKDYLINRGLSASTIDNFNIGFSPDLKNSFYNKSIENGFTRDYLIDTGLVISNEDNYVDRFRGRIMFPIKSISGRILGFGGRIINSNKKLAKYINSPESKIYNKSKTLYGIYESKQFIVKDDVCYLVEGYMDVVQLHEHGIKNVLASSGTSLTKDQIILIKRLTPNIVILFDGDQAGLSASLRSIDMILEEGLNVRICPLPDGEDPDSFVKKHKRNKMINYIDEQSKDLIDFILSVNKEYKNDEDKKVNIIKSILKSISLIPDSLKQEVYIKKLSSVLSIDESSLFRSFSTIETAKKIHKIKISNNSGDNLYKVKTSKKENRSEYIYQLERQIISILLKYGAEEIIFEDVILNKNEKGDIVENKKEIRSKVFEKIYLDLQQDEIEFTHEPFKEIYNKLINSFHNQNLVSIDSFINDLDPSSSKIVSDILINDEKYQLHDWEKKNIYVKKIGSELSQLVNETILNMRRYLIDKKINELQDNSNDNKEKVLEEVMSYYSLKKLLSAKLNRVV